MRRVIFTFALRQLLRTNGKIVDAELEEQMTVDADGQVSGLEPSPASFVERGVEPWQVARFLGGSKWEPPMQEGKKILVRVAGKVNDYSFEIEGKLPSIGGCKVIGEDEDGRCVSAEWASKEEDEEGEKLRLCLTHSASGCMSPAVQRLGECRNKVLIEPDPHLALAPTITKSKVECQCVAYEKRQLMKMDKRTLSDKKKKAEAPAAGKATADENADPPAKEGAPEDKKPASKKGEGAKSQIPEKQEALAMNTLTKLATSPEGDEESGEDEPCPP